MEYKYPSKYMKIYNKAGVEPFINPYLNRQSIDIGDGVHTSPINALAFPGITRSIDLFELGLKISKYQPCLGSRSSVKEPYVWLTYQEVNDQVKQFGSGLRRMAGYEEGADNFLGIYSRNSIPWVIAMLGAQFYSYAFVPLYDTLGKESIQHILLQTEMKVILCQGGEQARTLLTEFRSSISFVIIVEESPTARQLINDYICSESIKIYMFKDVLETGQMNPMRKSPLGPHDLSVICYTSGSTGTPKGVMLTGFQIVNAIASLMSAEGLKYYSERTVHSSHLPYPHIMEHLLLMSVFSNGGRAGLPTMGMASFGDDMRDLKPTVFASVPRLLVRLYEMYMEKAKDRPFAKKLLAMQLKTSLRQQRRGDYSKHGTLEKLLFKEFRERLGGHVCVVFCGGAPLSGSLKLFIQAALKCPLLDGYGQTETSGVISLGLTGDPVLDNAGSVAPDTKVKLFDVPEMELSVQINGAGEICVQSKRCSAGYYRDEENTAKLYHPDGWLRTGDIGQWIEGGRLKVVDRCKSMFKLSQGEYVAPEKVENVLQLSELVRLCLIYGKSTESYCVAIVVPSVEELHAQVEETGDESQMNGTVPGSSAATPPVSVPSLLQSTKVREYVLKKLNELGRQHGLKGFELPKNIYLTEEAFTVSNGFLTPTLKISRPQVTRHFMEEINAMYSEGELIKPSGEAAGAK